MIRWGPAKVVASVLLLCVACGGKTWQTTEPVTPTTYGRVDAPVQRSVGKLRRLALLPVKVDVTLPLFKGTFSKPLTRAAEEQLEQSWGVGTAAFLAGVKGYEVIRLEDLGEERGALQALALWATGAGADETPPPETARAVAAGAQRLSVDGFLIIHGLQRSPNFTTVFAVLTASLSWPLIFLEGRQEYRTEIVEAATGRVVWRANVWRAASELADEYRRFKLQPEDLFQGIEHAVPKVLTE